MRSHAIWAVGLILTLVNPTRAQDPFDECGELVAGVECTVFRIGEGRQFFVDDVGNFGPGDRVRVIGLSDEQCVTTCQNVDGCVEAASVTYCDGEFAACGELVQGIECVLFEDDRGFLFALDFAKNFEVGERVRVTGNFTRECVSICQQNTGCIEVGTIERVAEGGCQSLAGPPVCSGLSLALVALGLIGLRRSHPRR